MHLLRYWDPVFEDSMDLIAKLPTIAAAIYRHVPSLHAVGVVVFCVERLCCVVWLCVLYVFSVVLCVVCFCLVCFVLCVVLRFCVDTLP